MSAQLDTLAVGACVMAWTPALHLMRRLPRLNERGEV